jgi:hypothetical protein
MFGDLEWDDVRSAAQSDRLNAWLQPIAESEGRLAIVECGAGTAVPSIRRFCEQVARQTRGTLVRINPREPECPSGHVSLPLGALDALQQIDRQSDRLSRGSSGP